MDSIAGDGMADGAGAEGATGADALARIERLVRDGAFPPPGGCALCGLDTDEMVWLHVECERRTPLPPLVVPRRHPIFGRFSRLFIQREALAVEEPRFRREFVPVELPLRLHHRCWHDRPWSHAPRSLRMLLQVVPEYSELLAEHPVTLIEAAEPVPGR